jgi:hypothetical protein
MDYPAPRSTTRGTRRTTRSLGKPLRFVLAPLDSLLTARGSRRRPLRWLLQGAGSYLELKGALGWWSYRGD